MMDSDRCEECDFDYANIKHDPESASASCPSCGAIGRRRVSAHLTDSVRVREYLRMKAKRVGEKKPYIEAEGGEQVSLETGKWMMKRRVIDRDAGAYEERVVDSDSGIVVHECSERLSEHWGHGSARAQRRPDTPPQVADATNPDVED